MTCVAISPRRLLALVGVGLVLGTAVVGIWYIRQVESENQVAQQGPRSAGPLRPPVPTPVRNLSAAGASRPPAESAPAVLQAEDDANSSQPAPGGEQDNQVGPCPPPWVTATGSPTKVLDRCAEAVAGASDEARPGLLLAAARLFGRLQETLCRRQECGLFEAYARAHPTDFAPGLDGRHRYAGRHLESLLERYPESPEVPAARCALAGLRREDAGFGAPECHEYLAGLPRGPCAIGAPEGCDEAWQAASRCEATARAAPGPSQPALLAHAGRLFRKALSTCLEGGHGTRLGMERPDLFRYSQADRAWAYGDQHLHEVASRWPTTSTADDAAWARASVRVSDGCTIGPCIGAGIANARRAVDFLAERPHSRHALDAVKMACDGLEQRFHSSSGTALLPELARTYREVLERFEGAAAGMDPPVGATALHSVATVWGRLGEKDRAARLRSLATPCPAELPRISDYAEVLPIVEGCERAVRRVQGPTAAPLLVRLGRMYEQLPYTCQYSPCDQFMEQRKEAFYLSEIPGGLASLNHLYKQVQTRWPQSEAADDAAWLDAQGLSHCEMDPACVLESSLGVLVAYRRTHPGGRHLNEAIEGVFERLEAGPAEYPFSPFDQRVAEEARTPYDDFPPVLRRFEEVAAGLGPEHRMRVLRGVLRWWERLARPLEVARVRAQLTESGSQRDPSGPGTVAAPRAVAPDDGSPAGAAGRTVEAGPTGPAEGGAVPTSLAKHGPHPSAPALGPQVTGANGVEARAGVGGAKLLADGVAAIELNADDSTSVSASKLEWGILRVREALRTGMVDEKTAYLALARAYHTLVYRTDQSVEQRRALVREEREAYRKLVQMTPGDSDYPVAFVSTYTSDRERIEPLREMLVLRPKDVELMRLLGECLCNTGQVDEGIRYVKAVAKATSASDPEAMGLLGGLAGYCLKAGARQEDVVEALGLLRPDSRGR